MAGDAVHLVALVLAPDEAALLLRLVLQRAVYLGIVSGHRLEAVAVLGVIGVELDGRHVVRVIGHVELAPGVAAAPCEIRISGCVVGLHLVLASFHLEDEPVGRERGGLRLHDPEELLQGCIVQGDALRVDAFHVDLQPGLPLEGPLVLVQRIVPGLAGLQVLALHLLAGRQGVHVCKDKLPVDPGGIAAGGDVAAGVVPVLVKVLLLQAAEDGLDGLRRRTVRGGVAEQLGHLGEPGLGVRPLRASLVIADQLAGLVPGELQGGADGLVDDREGFVPRMEGAAQEDLAGCVDDLVYVQRGHPVLPVHVLLEEEVQLGAVHVPEGVPERGEDGGVLPAVDGPRCGVSDDGSGPAYGHLRTVQIGRHGGLGLDGLEAHSRGVCVELLEDLRVRPDGHLAALQRDEVVAGLRSDLHGVGVSQVSAHQAGEPLASVLAHLGAELRAAGRKGVAVQVTEGVALLVDGVPVHRRAVAQLTALQALALLHGEQPHEDGGVQGELLDVRLLQMRPVGENVVLEPGAGGRIDAEVQLILLFLLSHDLERVAVDGIEALPVLGGEHAIVHLRMAAGTLAAADYESIDATDEALVALLRHHRLSRTCRGFDELLEGHEDGISKLFHLGPGGRVSRDRDCS